ncbi:hypothetical protein ANN_19533 [Periplaneta americana]|uniref:Uncharacterized protein n=1 Tax=Periplaneta americana TaxID=6978 RepID=A0ABQ8SAT0_PERAM|nr:hypothetical protein ANN_19533 [Periplaneta americana]
MHVRLNFAIQLMFAEEKFIWEDKEVEGTKVQYQHRIACHINPNSSHTPPIDSQLQLTDEMKGMEAQTTTCTAAMIAIEPSSSFVPISLQRDVIVVHRSVVYELKEIMRREYTIVSGSSRWSIDTDVKFWTERFSLMKHGLAFLDILIARIRIFGRQLIPIHCNKRHYMLQKSEFGLPFL